MAQSPGEARLDQVEQDDDGSWIDTDFIQSVLGKEAEILHIDVQRATGKGDNYLSVIFRARVEYRHQSSDEVRVKSFIVKTIPPGEFLQKYIEELDIFGRETNIYDEVLPTLYAFADSRLGNDSFKRLSASFYKTERPGTLILDDLKSEGFVMASRKDRLDFPHAKLVVQNVARLHALSLAYTEKNPDFLSRFEDFLFCQQNRHRFEMMLSQMTKVMAEAIKKWEGFGEILKKMEHLEGNFLDKVIDTCKPFDKFPIVLLHGDCWVNNILFKYSETGTPVDLRFVDFQQTRRASPAIELHHFLFASLKNDVRVHHFDDLLHAYCNELARCAKQLGYGKPVFNVEDLRQEIERTMFFGFFISMSMLAVVLAEPDDTIDMKDITEEQMKSGEMFDKAYDRPAFRETFQQLLPYFDERGILD